MEEIELLQTNFVSELSKTFYYSFLGVQVWELLEYI